MNQYGLQVRCVIGGWQLSGTSEQTECAKMPVSCDADIGILAREPTAGYMRRRATSCVADVFSDMPSFCSRGDRVVNQLPASDRCAETPWPMCRSEAMMMQQLTVMFMLHIPSSHLHRWPTAACFGKPHL